MLNIDLSGTGEVAPFGNETEEELLRYKELSSKPREKGYEKLCKGCNVPESMKSFIDDDIYYGDEVYYCFWCDFIKTTEIDELLVAQGNKTLSNKNDKKIDYDEEDGLDALWELEDSGAFSDEGIMPGCHSCDWEYEYEAREVMNEFRHMAFVGNFIKTAREKAGLSVELLAKQLSMPESILEDIEKGEYINRSGNKDKGNLIMVPPTPVKECDLSKMSRKREWWEDCSDYGIKEKVADFLCDVIKPEIKKMREEKIRQIEAANGDEILPF